MKERKKYRGKETKPAVPRPAVPSLNLPTTPRPIFVDSEVRVTTPLMLIMVFVSSERGLFQRIFHVK